jgi:hypothetical protein
MLHDESENGNYVRLGNARRRRGIRHLANAEMNVRVNWICCEFMLAALFFWAAVCAVSMYAR